MACSYCAVCSAVAMRSTQAITRAKVFLVLESCWTSVSPKRLQIELWAVDLAYFHARIAAPLVQRTVESECLGVNSGFVAARKNGKNHKYGSREPVRFGGLARFGVSGPTTSASRGVLLPRTSSTSPRRSTGLLGVLSRRSAFSWHSRDKEISPRRRTCCARGCRQS